MRQADSLSLALLSGGRTAATNRFCGGCRTPYTLFPTHCTFENQPDGSLPHTEEREPNSEIPPYPASSSQDPVSSIQQPVSSIQYPASRLAAGRGLLAFDPGLDDVGCTADAWRDADGMGRAIQGTGPALHASVKVPDGRFFAFQQINAMGADVFTHAAAHTGLSVKLQGCHT